MCPSDNDRRPVIAWLIFVYDRTADKRFPLHRKWYRFDYDRATDDEIANVLRIVSKKPTGDPFPRGELKPGEGHITFEISSCDDPASREILRYRHLFERVEDEAPVFPEEHGRQGFVTVMLPPESYFEDENEKPITLTQIHDSETQSELGEGAFAIVYDQPDSILRLGPAQPIRPELWSEVDAELLAHLFDVHRQLANSRWLHSRCVVTPSRGGTLQAMLPDHEDCMAVIVSFRQLYSKGGMDDLFNRCCKIHNRHCPKDHPAFDWVKHYQDTFNEFLEKPPDFPFPDCSLSARRYLDAFAYGARVIHVSSKKEIPARDLEDLLASQSKELVVMGYHYLLHTLLGCVSMGLPIIRQNADHWKNDLNWPAKKRPGPAELFE